MTNKEKIVLGGGCFWCLDPIFQRLDGVIGVRVGFAGGEKKDPSYRDVCSGVSGHVEVLEVEFDTEKIALGKIFEVFFALHNPTSLNRQGGDVGTQYRSIILYDDIQQMILANTHIDEINLSGIWEHPVVTEVVPLEKFYPAEEYHQDYYLKNTEQSYCQIVIAPKVKKFKSIFE